MNKPVQPVFRLSDVTFDYRNTPCLESVDLTLSHNTFYGLIGPNGSGKTTLLNLLNATNTAAKGSVLFHGKNIQEYPKKELARFLAMVPQLFTLQFEYTVFEVVLMGRHPFIGRFANPAQGDLDLVSDALKALDIYHLRNRYVTQLSGGERQRVLVARALAQDTDVLILDEATASLDVRHSIDIMKVLRNRVKHRGATIVAAIHDLDLAASFCDELIVLNRGSIEAQGPVHSVLNSALMRDVFRVEADIFHHESSKSSHIRYRYHHEQV